MKKVNIFEKDIVNIVSSIRELTKHAQIQYNYDVEAIINDESIERKRIETLLDSLLDFCFDEEVVKIYKKLL